MALTDEELESSDCVIIVTDHSDIDYKRICSLVPLIVDTRNALNGDVRRESSANHRLYRVKIQVQSQFNPHVITADLRL